ncbi:MAG: hypothetical protein JST00_25875 [Deltaproteobacteria bacterium]|nr:hypothetical protein [Deltaproteobacteria bacterium]
MKRADSLLLVLPLVLEAAFGSGLARADTPPPSEPTAPAGAAAPSAPAPSPPEEDRVPVTVGVLYPLATNANRPNVTSNTDLSLAYGKVSRIEGLQLGAVAVHTEEQVQGAQIGAVAAVAGDVRGAQISTVNVAGPVDGAQIGVVNVGGKVRGLQLGVVNVAEETDGAAIGIVSISRDSVHPIAWSSSLSYMNAGVKFSTKYMFTMLAASYGTLEESLDNVGATAAIGGHIPLPASFDVELSGSYTQFVPRGGKDGNQWVGHQAIVGYSFAKHLRLFAGGGVRLPISVVVGREVTRPEVLAGIQF